MERTTLTVREVSEYLGISLIKAYDLTEREDFPLIRLGRRKIIPYDQFICWIEEECAKPNVQ